MIKKNLLSRSWMQVRSPQHKYFKYYIVGSQTTDMTLIMIWNLSMTFSSYNVIEIAEEEECRRQPASGRGRCWHGICWFSSSPAVFNFCVRPSPLVWASAVSVRGNVGGPVSNDNEKSSFPLNDCVDFSRYRSSVCLRKKRRFQFEAGAGALDVQYLVSMSVRRIVKELVIYTLWSRWALPILTTN